MIRKDYEETCDPFYLEPLQRMILDYFLLIPINPTNRGSKKGYLTIALTLQVVLVVHL